MKSRHGKRSVGFTLVELLVVVGVIAVLVAILLPVLGRARAQANRIVCLSNIRQLGMGVLMYCRDNNGYFPWPAYPKNPPAWDWQPEDWVYWEANRNLMDSAIAKYVVRPGDKQRFQELLRCPSDVIEGRRKSPGDLPGQGPYPYTYGLFDELGANDWFHQKGRTKLNMWHTTWRWPLLCETCDQTKNSYPSAVWSAAGYLSKRHGVAIFQGNVPGNSVLAHGNKVGSNASMVFMDGHAEGIEQMFAVEMIDRLNAHESH